MAIVIVQVKSAQKWYFLVSKPILKKFPRLFLSPNPSYAKKSGQKGLQMGFYKGGGFKSPPLLIVQSRGPFL